MICNQCGSHNRAGSLYCVACGSKLGILPPIQKVIERYPALETFSSSARFIGKLMFTLSLVYLVISVLVIIGYSTSINGNNPFDDPNFSDKYILLVQVSVAVMAISYFLIIASDTIRLLLDLHKQIEGKNERTIQK